MGDRDKVAKFIVYHRKVAGPILYGAGEKLVFCSDVDACFFGFSGFFAIFCFACAGCFGDCYSY